MFCCVLPCELPYDIQSFDSVFSIHKYGILGKVTVVFILRVNIMYYIYLWYYLILVLNTFMPLGLY